MAKSQRRKNSLPQPKSDRKELPVVGSGGTCTQAGIKVCVAIGGGGFVEQYIPMPPTPGARTLTIENGIIFWGQTQQEQIMAALQQIFAQGMQSVMQKKARPRKGKT